MINIAFVVLGVVSAGELTIAAEFARRLPREKVNPVFLVPDRFAYFFGDQRFDYIPLVPKEGKKKNREKMFRFFSRFKPHMVVVSDPFTMEYSIAWSGVKFDDLKELGVPVVGVDEYEYGGTGYKIDYYGSLVKQMPPLVDQCDYAIRNCPLNTPRRQAGHQAGYQVKNYSLTGQIRRLTAAEKQEVRHRLGIAPHRKVIFFTTSKWESMNMNKIISLSTFLKWRPIMLTHYLEAVKGDITLLHIGPEPLVDRAQKVNFDYRHLQNVAPRDFEDYLLSADLFVTFNIVSVSLSKAVFGNVPSLVLQNHKLIDFSKLQNRLAQMPTWYREMAGEVKRAFPFKASTFGWNHFLTAVLTDNPYVETFERAGFFKMTETVGAIERLLFDGGAVADMNRRQQSYTDGILQLPTPGRIVEEILNGDTQ